ncbi:hypothetical protein HDU79_008834 [Rhizoclosmatium sp. JEL0117]|nr:hypothetical protein HDU79_008834 [Rhizoclosmatium sp. JEL0117]
MERTYPSIRHWAATHFPDSFTPDTDPAIIKQILCDDEDSELYQRVVDQAYKDEQYEPVNFLIRECRLMGSYAMEAALSFKTLDVLDHLCLEHSADWAPCDDPQIGRFFLYSSILSDALGENWKEKWFHIINVSMPLCGIIRGYQVDSPDNPYVLQDSELLEIVQMGLMSLNQEAMTAILTLMSGRNLKIDPWYISFTDRPEYWRHAVIKTIRLALPFIAFEETCHFDGLPRESLPDLVTPCHDSLEQEAINLRILDIVCESFELDTAICAFFGALLKTDLSCNDRSLLQNWINLIGINSEIWE